MIKAIIFDFDGLIIDTETIWYEAYREVLLKRGIELSLQTFGLIIGTHNTALQQYVKEQSGDKDLYDKVSKEANLLHLERMAGIDARPGVRDYLEQAASMGLLIGLASSSDRKWVEGFLKKLGLIEYFNVIKTGDDVTRIKPDPELYLQAIAALGVAPNEAVAFEDSVNGSKAAKAAGIYCVIVPNPVTEGMQFQHCDLHIRSMGEKTLTEVLKHFN